MKPVPPVFYPVIWLMGFFIMALGLARWAVGVFESADPAEAALGVFGVVLGGAFMVAINDACKNLRG